jgi:hypothetical protein
MKRNFLVILVIIVAIVYGCAPLQSITRHDLSSGYFKLKYPGAKSEKVYIDLNEDSVTVYKVNDDGRSANIDLNGGSVKIGNVKPGSFLYQGTFVKRSLDFDLSTVALKYRPQRAGVPNQLSYNVNALFYLGMRRDYYIIKSHSTPLNRFRSNLLQIGFDAGLFAGFGITPVNPTVTDFKITQEYDGFFLQKGIAAFFTLDQMSVGLSLGFDNLLDPNSGNWIYNQKPWIGIIIGIANF